jgi:general secretion pathway protein L
MSVLVILLPSRPRTAGVAPPPADYAYACSTDGRGVERQGRAPATQLPQADRVIAVVPDGDLGWQRVAVPRAPAARLRAALGAVLEERLLDDDEAVHLALAPGLVSGQTGWVAVVHRDWLNLLLGDLERAGTRVDAVLPSSWPRPDARLHALAAGDGDEPVLVWSHDDGVSCLHLAGGLARQQLAGVDRQALACTAHPAAVAQAERWLEAPVAVLGDAERALQAITSGWNLRQFEFAPRHRGLQSLRDALRQLTGPEWRALRVGLAALLLLQVVGLNAWAWRLDQAVQDKRGAMTQLLQASHPQVRSVLDAPVQMQRETDLLRVAAGRAGPTDFEPMLAAAAAAWPDGQGPLQKLRFEPGRLTLDTRGWGDAQRLQFADRLRAAGYGAENQGEQVLITAGGRS